MKPKQGRAVGKRLVAAAAALPMMFAALPAATAVAAELQVGDSGMTAVAIDANKVLGLSFDAGDLTDSSASKNVVEKTKGEISYVDGVSGKGANFANAAASLGVSEALQPKNLTLSFWYKPNAAISGEQILMWTKGEYNQDGWYLSANAENKPLVLSIGPKGTGSQPAEFVMDGKRSEIFKANQWTHVMVTWDDVAKAAAFYINGIKQSSHTDGDQSAVKTVNPTADTKFIGWNGAHNSAGTLNGVLDEVELWNVVANTADVEREVKVGDADFDAAAVATDALNGLNIKSTATSNLTLPTSATNGATITWTSDNEGVISATGTVTRPAEGDADATATLTATATYGSKTVSKTFTITVPAQSSSSGQEYSEKYLSESDMSNVAVANDYLINAGQKEIEYLLSFDTDRLLVEFRKQAGLDTKGAKNYGGWERGYGEGSRFTGHFVGHYVSAISEAQRSTFATAEQKAQLATKLKAMVLGIREAQEAFAKKDSANAGFFPAFKVNAVPNGADGLIVPFYNLHKVEQGMVDAYKYATDDEVREAAQAAAVDFAQWIVNWKAAHESTNMLKTEYGGMNDALYQVAEIAPDLDSKQVALKAAHLFDETALFEKLAAGQDPLNGLHANTTIPKLTGAMQRYVAYTSDPELYSSLSADEQDKLTSLYLKAAQNFWDITINHHTYVNGGNSQSEHFHVSDQLWKDATQNGDPANGGGYNNNSTVETCNEHNMLKLTRLLFQVTRDAKYSEYYEHTFINAILASQNPETGMTMYFQPMKAGYPKVFGTEYGEFWCCQGTGIENFAKLNDSFYFTDKDDVYVNMFLASTFTDKRHGLRIVQTGDVPKQDTVSFEVSKLDKGADKDATGTANLKLRVPEWAENPMLVVDGATQELVKDANGWVTVPVAAGTKISYTLPAKLQAHTAQDNENWVAFTYGPLVLAGPLRETDASSNYSYGGVLVRTAAYDAESNAMAQIFPADNQSTADWLKDFQKNLVRTDSPDDGEGITFQFRNVEGDAANIVLQPYYTLYETTYAVYWDLAEVDSEGYQNQILSTKDEERDNAFNIDALTAFDNQEQNEMGSHNLHKVNSSAGSYADQPYRDAKTDGWISYDFKVDPAAEKNYFGVRLYSGDADRNGFDVLIDPTPLTSETDQAAGKLSENAQQFTITYKNSGGFYWENLKIPADLIDKVKDAGAKTRAAAGSANTVRLKFVANGSTKTAIGGLYGVRTTTATDYSTDAKLKGLSFDVGKLSGGKFDPSKNTYTLTVPADAKSVNATFTTAGRGEYVMVDGVVVKDGKDNPREITLTDDVTTVEVTSVAQDRAITKGYEITIVKEGATVPEKTMPVIEYNFDKDADVASGKTVTNSGSLEASGNGVMVNGGASLVADGAGSNKSLKLNGGDKNADSTAAHVRIPAGAIADDQSDLTVRMRMKWDGKNSCIYPFNLGQDSQNYLSYIVSCGSNSRVESKVNNSTMAVLSGATPATNQWVDVVAVLKGGKSLSYYLDGKLVKTASTTLTAAQVKGTKDFTGYLGKSFYDDPYFGGEIDDFRMWGRALTAVELFEGNDPVNPEPEPEPEPSDKSDDATLKSLTVAGQPVDLAAAASEAGAKLTVDDPDAVTDGDVRAVASDDKAADPKIEVKDGVVTVTVTAEDGTTTKTYKVTLERKAPVVIPVTGVKLDQSEMTLTVGDAPAMLKATVQPENATNQKVTWVSSDSKVATVDADGKVTAVAAGVATITVTTEDGNKTAAVTVTVKAKIVPVESVTIAGDGVVDGALALKVGETSALTATVAPENATDKTVAWASSDSKVATVDVDGVVSAVAAGTARITATAGGKSAAVTVTVTKDEPVAPPASDEEFDTLEEAIQAEADAKLDEKDYTADSWAVYQAALTAAKDVLANKQSTSEQVAAAIDKLDAAKLGLTKVDSGKEPGDDDKEPGGEDKPSTPDDDKPGDDGDEKPGDGDQGGDGQEPSPSDPSTPSKPDADGAGDADDVPSVPQTGAAVAAVMVAVIALAAAGIGLIAWRKRNA